MKKKLKWKKISTKVVFDNPRLKILEDRVLLPNKQEIQYLKFAPSAEAVTIIAINRDGKILLQKEYSYPPDKELYQFPGGSVLNKESLKTGANRELMEESGLKAGKLKFLGYYFINNRRSNQKMYVYLAKDLIVKKINGDVEEDIKNYWFSEEQIDVLIRNNKIENYSLLSAWILYKLKK